MHLEVRTNYDDETPRTRLFFVGNNQTATLLKTATIYGFAEFQESIELLQKFWLLAFNQEIKIIHTK